MQGLTREALAGTPVLDALDLTRGKSRGTTPSPRRFQFATLPAFSEDALKRAKGCDELVTLLSDFRKKLTGDIFHLDLLIVATLKWFAFTRPTTVRLLEEDFGPAQELPTSQDLGACITYYPINIARTEYY